MIDIKNALCIPGVGFSMTKTKDQSLGSAEADFEALMKEVQAAREKREAQEGNKEAFTRAELTEADIKELAADYDPTNMTQEEYDAFLDGLIEKGVLEKEDLKYIDYRGNATPLGELVCVGRWDFLADGPMTNAGISHWNGNSFTWTGASGLRPNFPFASAYRPTDADVLAWAKELSLWKPVGNPNPALDANNRRYDIFNVLADALDAMQRQRVKDGV